MERPAAPGSSSVKPGSYKPSDLNPELARLEAVKEFMKKSGDLARTSQKQEVYTGILKALKKQGFDTTPMIDAFDEIARLSPDLNGLSRTEMLALLSPPKLVIPGLGRTDVPFQDNQPGLLGRIWQGITGKSNQGSQVQQ